MSSVQPSGHGESEFRGVARDTHSNKWRAYIQLHLGYYATEEEAAEIYARADDLFREQALDLRRRYGDSRDE